MRDTLQQRVLVCVATYLPGYKAGGPIRSVENLVAKLGGEFDFRIVTSDHDFGEEVPFPGIPANRWIRTGNAYVIYLRPGFRGFLRMSGLLSSLDQATVLYLNSFFSVRFSILAMWLNWLKVCRPQRVVLAPRGEFSRGALQLKSQKKRCYIGIVRWLRLYRDVFWQASSDREAEDIARQFPQARHINIASDLSGSVTGAADLYGEEAASAARRKTPGRLRALFVSRVSRMKNLSGAMRMLEGISGDVSFDIYGPAEDAAYWEECQALIAALPANIRVEYRGEIEHGKLGQVFREHELLFLPTLGENYGHVICESLMWGCPVLISDQTPWRDLETEGVGWAIPLGERERFRAVLQRCVDGDAEWHRALSARALSYAAKLASDPQAVEANRRLFQRAFAESDDAHPITVQA